MKKTDEKMTEKPAGKLTDNPKNADQKKNVNQIILIAVVTSIICAAVLSITGEKILSRIFLILLSGISVGAAFFNRSGIMAWFSSRKGRRGIENSVRILIVFAITTAVYLLFYFSVITIRKDLTKSRLYSLSEFSENALSRLDFPVNILLFNHQSGDPLMDVLPLYTRLSKNITYRFVNSLKEPELTKQYNVTQPGSLVFTADNKLPILLPYRDMIRETADEFGRPSKEYRFEEKITSAILGFIDSKKSTVHFLEGHGEKSIKDFKESGLSTLAATLRAENIEPVVLNILTEKTIPDDCGLLIIPGPRGKMTDHTLALIRKFSARRGALFIMLDPLTDINNTLTGLEALLDEYGIIARDDVIIDPVNFLPQMGHEQGPFCPVIRYDYHQIVNDLSRRNLHTVFFSARSVDQKKGMPENFVYNTVLNSFDTAWGERDIADKNKRGLTKNRDYAGPVCLGAVMQKRINNDMSKEIRIACYGDSDFINNAVIDFVGHKDLFINTVRWLMAQENYITIRPRTEETSELYMPRSRQLLAVLFFVIIIPIGILAGGLIFIYRRKRKKGADL